MLLDPVRASMHIHTEIRRKMDGFKPRLFSKNMAFLGALLLIKIEKPLHDAQIAGPPKGREFRLATQRCKSAATTLQQIVIGGGREYERMGLGETAQCLMNGAAQITRHHRTVDGLQRINRQNALGINGIGITA